ncbi:metalloregulator ArsR/SmtB family transcription factor [Actinomadura sp. NBRC 104412]|uniref:ArsR/SmtB family transcription factor n=1 Tax=Actinomadura sp. NBRC 104412 TaxID=3032203 RepID=UPI002554723B|nr:metalloregulator ArsR/SmtB family transcription factor [Actinomadura sp. NBRC 104412]
MSGRGRPSRTTGIPSISPSTSWPASPKTAVPGVLGDPVRRRILEPLADGERAAGEISAVVLEEFGISQPGVSQHLRVLRENASPRCGPPKRAACPRSIRRRCARSTFGGSSTGGSGRGGWTPSTPRSPGEAGARAARRWPGLVQARRREGTRHGSLTPVAPKTAGEFVRPVGNHPWYEQRHPFGVAVPALPHASHARRRSGPRLHFPTPAAASRPRSRGMDPAARR